MPRRSSRSPDQTLIESSPPPGSPSPIELTESLLPVDSPASLTSSALANSSGELSIAQPIEPPAKLPELGLVCITASDAVRYKTMTRKRLLLLEVNEQARVLRELYAENLRRLQRAIEFCQQEKIRLYRLSSGLFPFADEMPGEAVLEEFAEEMGQVGTQAMAAGIRLVLHPDQFVVLSSDRPEVIANSIKILRTHARIFDLLGLPQSPWALMNIHGGKGDRAERLIQVIRDLPDSIRLRLTLENDEYTYSTAELLDICRAAEVPLVFDAHHHLVHEHLETYEDPSVCEMLAAARTTWQVPEWQLVHISNGESYIGDQKHSELIYFMPSCYWDVEWIEIEAKKKEQAIAKLREEWRPGTLVQPAPEEIPLPIVEQTVLDELIPEAIEQAQIEHPA